MLIDRLIVRKTEPTVQIIREVPFNRKGISLIVDNTKDILSESGNNVGKTTVIRIINLCLGGKSVKELYYDTDTTSENDDIKDFLVTNKVQAELILLGEDDERIFIKRDLFPNGKRYIDNERYVADEFNKELKRILFKSSEESPTFRQLIGKFIRLTNTSADSMLKYLHSNVKNVTYDAIYCFLFRLLSSDLVSEKNILSEELAECQKNITMLEKNKNIISLSMLKQRKDLINKDIDELQNKRNQLSYMDEYKDELNKKRNITTTINKLEEEITLLDCEIKIIEESLLNLDREKCTVNVKVLEAVYKEAKRYLPSLHKDFNDLVKFHNDMIQDRINFILGQLKEKQKRYNKYSNRINSLLEEKKKITIEILDEGLLDELNVLNKRIEELSEQRGQIIQSETLLEEQYAKRAEKIKLIEKIDEKIDGDDTNKRISIFNDSFSAYCEKLFGEKYLISYNTDWKDQEEFPITLAAAVGSVGTGMKKAIITAFDLAYLKYSEIMDIQAPKFIIHDKLENTHINQLKTIFDICQGINGQYIFPILRERIDKVENDLIETAKVLELSGDDKFFRI